jgi:signal transduction histidine kinase
MKIRMRLTLWYIGVSSLILLTFSLGTYFGMQRLLFRALDQELNSLIESIERNYDPFFEHFQDFLFSPDNTTRYLEHYILVYNNNQRVIFASPMAQRINLDVPLPTFPEKISYTRKIKLVRRLPYLRTSPIGEVTFRVITRQIFFQGNQIGWVTAGSPIQQIEGSMENLLIVLLVAVILAIILVSSGGYLLLRQALLPINRITQKAQIISSTNLSERIPVTHKEDELGRLSQVLNDLLFRLQNAFGSQQQFLADAAHELKTPLAVLRTHWENELNNPAVSLELKEKFVQDIETITRLTHLINNLLLLSQTELIRENFEFLPVRLDTVLDDVIADASIMADLKSQHIEREKFPATSVNGDKVRLYQLFFNIVDNAIKYTPDEGKVWVSLRHENHAALVEVKDSGMGIPVEDIPHIFERFYRVQKDRARKTGGSGLGLSICKLIAESHQGSISVQSEENQGTNFAVRLPLLENGEDKS